MTLSASSMGGSVVAIKDEFSTARFVGCAFADGNTVGSGGCVLQGADTSANFTACAFTSCIATGFGGAIEAIGGETWIQDSTFTDNEASAGGGHIACSGGAELDVVRTTFVGGFSETTGGVAVLASNSRSTFEFKPRGTCDSR